MAPDEQALMDELWQAEIDRRVAELDEGKVKAIPWEEVRRELLARRSDQAGVARKPYSTS